MNLLNLKKLDKRVKMKKIKDKSINLDVKGQGCWNDCFHAAHWENNTARNSKNCAYHGKSYNSQINMFL